MDDFAGLTISEFFILEDGENIIATGALWNQRNYKQYIAIGYKTVYKFVTHCSPLFQLFHYPPLPKMNTIANFAYISFFLCRKNYLNTMRVFLGELAVTAHDYDFLTVGAVNGDDLGEILASMKSIKVSSKLCIVDFEKNGIVPIHKTPFRFECALL